MENFKSVTADEALSILMEGNLRFAGGNSTHPNQSAERRVDVAQNGQHPIAAVLYCSDSREPVEHIFDQGIGDIFGVRLAGNIASDEALGSLEYAADHLGVPLIMVLGHTGCGAVDATVKGGTPHGHVGSLVKAIGPSVEKAKRLASDPANHGEVAALAVLENVKAVMETIRQSEIISSMLERGVLKVTGAVYNIESGRVEML